MLTFDPIPHEYRLDGHPLPSVTTILNQWLKVDAGWSFYLNTITGQKIDAGVFEAAGDRGAAVHTILQLCVTGQGVDRESLDPSLVPYLDHIEEWVDRYKPKAIICEEPMCAEGMGFAGTPDLFCECRGIKHAVLLDGKSGQRGPVDLQTSAYERLIRINTGYKGLVDRYVLQLGVGGYSFESVGRAGDFGMFKQYLAVYNDKQRRA